MSTHKNAPLTPKGRAHLVAQIALIGLQPAAEAAGISTRTARKWQRRFAAQGASGPLDRSSRHWCSPTRSDRDKIERAVALRRNQRLTDARIAERMGLSKSAIAQACQRAGFSRLPPMQTAVPVRRYERKGAGQLLRLDAKKLARFDQPGHRVTGDRTRCTRRAGSQALQVAIDDHSRVGSGLMRPDETAKSACIHLLAALRDYKRLSVRIGRVMTDNGADYTSRRFARLLRRLKIRHIHTRPYTPHTNGKAERLIQTLLKEWAYAYCYPSSEHRANALAP